MALQRVPCPPAAQQGRGGSRWAGPGFARGGRRQPRATCWCCIPKRAHQMQLVTAPWPCRPSGAASVRLRARRGSQQHRMSASTGAAAAHRGSAARLCSCTWRCRHRLNPISRQTRNSSAGRAGQMLSGRWAGRRPQQGGQAGRAAVPGVDNRGKGSAAGGQGKGFDGNGTGEREVAPGFGQQRCGLAPRAAGREQQVRQGAGRSSPTASPSTRDGMWR